MDADTAAAERTASKREEDARRSQQAQPKYSEPSKAVGKAEAVAQPLPLAPRKRRLQEQATRPMARMDAADPRTGEDAGTGTTPATAGLSSDHAESFL